MEWAFKGQVKKCPNLNSPATHDAKCRTQRSACPKQSVQSACFCLLVLGAWLEARQSQVLPGKLSPIIIPEVLPWVYCLPADKCRIAEKLACPNWHQEEPGSQSREAGGGMLGKGTERLSAETAAALEGPTQLRPRTSICLMLSFVDLRGVCSMALRGCFQWYLGKPGSWGSNVDLL